MTAKTDAKAKTCSRCGKRRPLGKFGKNAAHRDGLQSDCNDCRKAREAGYRAARAFAALPAKKKRVSRSIEKRLPAALAELKRSALPTTNIPVKTKKTARKVAS